MAETDLIRTPLYEQLKVMLQELIGSDDYKVEDKFLSERQICERFDVSRATANKAMSVLLSEGILEFRKGIGTFIVNQSPIDKHFHENLSFTNKTLAMGQKPSTKILDFYQTTAGEINPSIMVRLGISKGEHITVAKRLRLADNKPVIIECHYFRARFFDPPLKTEDIIISVYDAITKTYGIHLQRMDETIRSIPISGKNREIFQLKMDITGFLMHFVPYIDEDTPLYFAEVLYRGDSYEFHNRIGPILKSQFSLGMYS